MSGAPTEEDPPGTRLLAALEASIAAEEGAAPRAAHLEPHLARRRKP